MYGTTFSVSVEGHLDCFQFLDFMNRVVTDTVEQVSLCKDKALFGYIPKSDTAEY